MSVIGKQFIFQAKEAANNLEPLAEGLWTSSEHTDLGFLSNDETDWETIEPLSFWHRHRNRMFLEMLQRFPPSGTLFEIGAGAGSVTMALQDAGYPVVGVEPTDSLAVRARARGVKNLVRSTLENAHFRNGALHNIGMFDVLEHIPDDQEYLRNLRQLMPEGGRFYCAVPAWNFLWSNEDDAADHIRRYSLPELVAKLNNAGFELEMATYYFAILLPPILFLRSIPTRLGLRRKRTHEASHREHILKPGLVSSIVDFFLELEFTRFKSGRPIHFGASVIAVAKAKS